MSPPTGRTQSTSPFGGGLLNPQREPWLLSPPNPDVGGLIDAIMTRLMANPNDSLGPRFNTQLLQIFEGFRHLHDDKHQLQMDVQQEAERRGAVERAMCESAEQWEVERQEFKAEVKRLELILAKGERGLAEVTLARQDSLLRRGRGAKDRNRDTTLEAVFEFLERSRRYEERLWHSQRATMKKRPASPSAAMRRLSTRMTLGSSTANLHHDFAVGTPRDVSILEQRTQHSPARKSSVALPEHPPMQPVPSSYRTENDVSLSNASVSAFSCDGDLLPDETSDLSLIKVAGTDNDFVAMSRIAQILARRRQIDPDAIMDKLTRLFNNEPLDSEGVGEVQRHGAPHPSRAVTTVIRRAIGEPILAKQPSLKSKASSFFSRWKPQLQIDTASTKRRFSFEPGDDIDTSLSAPALEHSPASTTRRRALRKSASTSVLLDGGSIDGGQIEVSLPPLAQSPTTVVSSDESRKPSRIPTPVYNSASLARPRSERDSSQSSLLTAIKHASQLSQRSDSSSSSSSDVSPAAQNHSLVLRTVEGLGLAQTTTPRSISSNQLLEHTNLLRGNAFAAAAARAATSATATVNGEEGKPNGTYHARMRGRHRDASSQSRTSRYYRDLLTMYPQSRGENDDPMGGADRNATL